MDPKERRIFPRFNLQVNVSFRVLDNQGARRGSTRNISGSGVCLISDQPLEKDDLLELDIALLEEGKPIVITGKVVWINEFYIGEGDRAKRFDVGVEFINVGDETLKRLNKFLFNLRP
jgi:hypothetical protein